MTSDLQKLLTWLSPAFPVGAFAWSAGLETAIVQGTVGDRATTEEWVAATLDHGGIKTDAILLAHAHRSHADQATLRDLADLCLALTPARERHAETVLTGNAFVLASAAWPTESPLALPKPCPYPIAIGATAGAHGIDALATITAFLTSTVHSQVSVAVRLVPIGQNDGLAIMASLEPRILKLAEICLAATLDDIGSVAYCADIAQMQHETLGTRIFRS
ncbi:MULTISPECIES: urease accessory protein UreF [unclassified Devosia]|uniref:urease accessory protein UreF n=1 Tax=unclassified Devosia TaxID=196773 RepID=UPI00145F0048|nr:MULTISPECIES: urease accessory protein UreF [unclassified Devosia]MBJ6986667.1 urease accessory protein UreF [Devosia sp. MC521]QMW61703.1 urease accessory protein UreF [Devosia sp. MC521]